MVTGMESPGAPNPKNVLTSAVTGGVNLSVRRSVRRVVGSPFKPK
jgi:hypothetical protein